MEKGVIELNGSEYVLGPKGVFVDMDGNPCGFVCSDIVKSAGLEAPGNNLVDGLVRTASEKIEAEGAKAALVELVIITAAAGMAAVAVGTEAAEYYEADEEADQAEAQAAEMQERLEAARRRHGK